jgi:hypothetical protein
MNKTNDVTEKEVEHSGQRSQQRHKQKHGARTNIQRDSSKERGSEYKEEDTRCTDRDCQPHPKPQ